MPNNLEQIEIEELLTTFSPTNSKPVITLLESDDLNDQLDGLYIFSELGSIGRILIPYCTKFLHHKNQYARIDAVKGISFHVEFLDYATLAKILVLLVDSNIHVKKAAYITLSCISDARTLRVIDYIVQEDLRYSHHLSHDETQRIVSKEALIKKINLSNSELSKIYGIARLIRLYRLKQFSTPICDKIHHSDTDYITALVDRIRVSSHLQRVF